MKRATTMKRTDVILSVGTLALILLAVVGMAVTGSINEFTAWAWERHHNVLSWYIRPLFFLPFCYFAYRRSLFGMVLTLVALATSMFWFPAPEHDRIPIRSSSWLWRGSTSPEIGQRRRSLWPCSCRSVSRR